MNGHGSNTKPQMGLIEAHEETVHIQRCSEKRNQNLFSMDGARKNYNRVFIRVCGS